MKRVTGLSVNMCSGQERKTFCDFIKHTKECESWFEEGSAKRRTGI